MTNAAMIEYSNKTATTIVYVVDNKHHDIIAMPVLFPENRFAMAKEAWALAMKK